MKHLVTILINVGLVASVLAKDVTTLRGSELAAAAAAVARFREIYAKPNLQHYKVELKRHGDLLDVTFLADTPHTYPRGSAGTGGDSVYGPDMTYTVSVKTLKIISFNYYR
jgi:hypothetical protein